MSADNVELVRALLPPADRDLVAFFNDEEAVVVVSAAGALFDSSTEIRMQRVDAEGRNDFGLEGLIRTWLDWLGPWESYRADIQESHPRR